MTWSWIVGTDDAKFGLLTPHNVWCCASSLVSLAGATFISENVLVRSLVGFRLMGVTYRSVPVAGDHSVTMSCN
jgi:hypothetical protein